MYMDDTTKITYIQIMNMMSLLIWGMTDIYCMQKTVQVNQEMDDEWWQCAVSYLMHAAVE